MKVRIKKLPQARTGYQVKGSLANDVPAFGGADYNAYIGKKPSEVRKTMTSVPREQANLEAEGGETVVGNIDGSGMPSKYNIEGPRHHSGGVPLNLPDDSFIFSDTKSMIIKDPKILKMFGVSEKKGGYTPAELSKKYDLNKYRKILQDPNSDKLERKTAELMVKNYTIKLGALALAQESQKGFPQGIPVLARPYMESMGIKEEELVPQEPQQEQMAQQAPQQMPDGSPIAMPQEMMEQMPMAMYGMNMGGYDFPYYQTGGFLPKVQNGIISEPSDNIYYGPGDSEYDMRLRPLNMDILERNYNLFRDQQLNEDSEEEINFHNKRYQNALRTGKYNTTEAKYGGFLPKAQDGVNKRPLTQEELKQRAKDKAAREKVQNVPEGYYDIGDNRYAKGTISTEFNPQRGKYGSGRAGAHSPALKKSICEDLSKGVSVEKLLEGNPVGTKAGIEKMYADCIKKGQEARKKAEEGTNEDIDVVEKIDEETGEIVKKCYCPDEYGNEIETDMVDGKCECENYQDMQSDMGAYGQQQDLEGWYPQDVNNLYGALGTQWSRRKGQPWSPRVDLEEPRPTFLDPTRELAAQSEQANIAALAVGQFAGPQALNARLSQIQGQGAKSAADTLSRYNNANVGIANQFEGQQVGIRNQEQMMNQQLADRLYDETELANQNFANTRLADRMNSLQMYNTGITNETNRLAMNQLYPDYKTDRFGRILAMPTKKKTDPTAESEDALTYALKLKESSLSDKIQADLLNRKFPKAKKGGQAGYVYGDMMFPFIL
jgi:hypothetical protein